MSQDRDIRKGKLLPKVQSSTPEYSLLVVLTRSDIILVKVSESLKVDIELSILLLLLCTCNSRVPEAVSFLMIGVENLQGKCF